MILFVTYGIHFTFSVYQVQTAILALAEASVLRPSMRQGVAEISKACHALFPHQSSKFTLFFHYHTFLYEKKMHTCVLSLMSVKRVSDHL